MIWATVSSRFCNHWLYRASPSMAAKNIINLILILTIWLCPCAESFLVLLEECLLWPVCSLDKTPIAFAVLHFVLQEQTCLLLQVSPDFLLLHSNPLWWKGHLFLVLVLEELVDLQTEPVHFSFFSISRGAQTWITVMLNGLPSKQTEIILSFLTLHPRTAFQTLDD